MTGRNPYTTPTPTHWPTAAWVTYEAENRRCAEEYRRMPSATPWLDFQQRYQDSARAARRRQEARA